MWAGGLCEGRDADRHAGDVVAVAADARLGGVAHRHPPRLAVRGDAGRLRRRAAAVVRGSGPADVLLLRGTDGAVPRDGPGPDARRYPRPRAAGAGPVGAVVRAGRRTPKSRTTSGVPVSGSGDRQLHLAVAHSHRPADHAVQLARPPLATQLALRFDAARGSRPAPPARSAAPP